MVGIIVKNDVVRRKSLGNPGRELGYGNALLNDERAVPILRAAAAVKAIIGVRGRTICSAATWRSAASATASAATASAATASAVSATSTTVSTAAVAAAVTAAAIAISGISRLPANGA